MYVSCRICFALALVVVLTASCGGGEPTTQPSAQTDTQPQATPGPSAAPVSAETETNEATAVPDTAEAPAAVAELPEALPGSTSDDEEVEVPVTTPKGPAPSDFVTASDAAPLGYTVTAVDNGGKLTGKISFTGDVQAPKVFKVEKTPEICGADDRLLYEVTVNGGNLQDVVLALEGVKSGKPFANFAITGPPPGTRQLSGTNDKFMGTTLKPQKCIFGAFTGVIAAGSVIRFDNFDPVKHSPHTYEVRGRVRDSLHNQDLEGNGFLKLGIRFKKDTAKVIKLECDQHNHMQNWFYRVENPYFAFSAADGTYEITGVPPGTYKLIAWHPIFGEQDTEVTIEAGRGTEADFEFTSARQRRRRRTSSQD